jgi:DNA polymerase III epsilon subunit-like protein
MSNYIKDIKDIKDKNEKIYLVFDTETSGIPKRVNYNFPNPENTSEYDGSRIIEIAYIIVNQDFEYIKSYQTLIKPDFPILNSDIHKITNEMAHSEGKDIKEVLQHIEQDFKKVDFIIAHNIDFDYNILLAECYRYDSKDFIKSLKNKERFCTMNYFRWNKKFNALKYPKLSEMYKYLFNSSFEGQHRALNDCIACLMCFEKMVKDEEDEEKKKP